MNRNYVDLVKSVRRGSVLACTSFGEGYSAGTGRWVGTRTLELIDAHSRLKNWERPNYDFGHIFDRLHSDWLGEANYSDHYELGFQRLIKREFFLPHNQCAYMLSLIEDEYDHNRSYCILLDQNEDGITGAIFGRQDAPRDPWRRWIMDIGGFCLSNDGKITYVYNCTQPNASQEAIETITQGTERMVMDMIVATTLIMSPRELIHKVQKQSTSLDILNRNRKFGTPRLDAPTVVHVNRAAMDAHTSALSQFNGSGTLRRPHERRAHVRVLWRGTEKEREVKVRAASINGGNPMQPYRVAI